MFIIFYSQGYILVIIYHELSFTSQGVNLYHTCLQHKTRSFLSLITRAHSFFFIKCKIKIKLNSKDKISQNVWKFIFSNVKNGEIWNGYNLPIKSVGWSWSLPSQLWANNNVEHFRKCLVSSKSEVNSKIVKNLFTVK